MARTETLVQLTEPLIELLDRTAAKRGISRSQLIREAIALHLGVEERADIDRRIVEGYRRQPQSDDEVAEGERRRKEAWSELMW